MKMNKLMNVKPFMKWAGGKSQLLSSYQRYYPKELKSGKVKYYFEPFLGGGAVFFDIAKKYPIRTAYLTDINEELILAFKVVQRDPEILIDFLSKYSMQYYSLNEKERMEYYYEIRKNLNLQRFQINFKVYSDSWIPRAAQLIFLNKTCFNGLFRINKKGEFNVPFGKYKNPKILDEGNILSISKILEIAEIQVGHFDITESKIDDNSFVYFDPPYRPLSRTSSFTSYSKYSFNETNQTKLGKYFLKLHIEKKPKLMLSNSDPKNENPHDNFFDNLYHGFNINIVSANRMINCNGNKRGKINELLITNY